MGFKKANDRRAAVLIDQRLQTSLMVRSAVAIAVSCGLFVGLAFLTPALLSSSESAGWLRTETQYRLEAFGQFVFLPLASSMLILFTFGVLETFKIAGPNYRMKSVLDSINARYIPRGIQFRKRDYLQDTRQKLDQFLISLHDDFQILRQQSRVAMESMGEMQNGNPDAATTCDAAIQEIHRILAQFQLQETPWDLESITDPIVEPSTAPSAQTTIKVEC